MHVDFLSLFPESFDSHFNASIVKRALEKRLVTVGQVNIRDFSQGKHRRVDDSPYGGGPGMVLMAEPVAKAIRSVKKPESHVIALSPQGSLLTAKKCRELASNYSHLILVCGHYEGIDQRVIDSDVDEEISIGDYVLTNGCLPAQVLFEAVIRFIPGVLGHEEGANQDSFASDELLLEGPQYTKPEEFEGRCVPEVLLSGNHKEIARWRQSQALLRTEKRRPDLLEGKS